MINTKVYGLLLAASMFSGTSAKADWLQFRGEGGSAVSTEAEAPTKELKVAWTMALPGRGLSSPIIVGDKVFLTAASGPKQESLHVICFNAADGKVVWERKMKATGRTMAHSKTCVAAPTPCSDGKRVYALYSCNDLFAFDLEGNLKWLRGLTYDYANASNSLGMAQSPSVMGDALVVQSENDSESFAAGLNLDSGGNLWKVDRPKAANWTSAIHVGGAVALQSSKGILALNPRTGNQAWNYLDGAATIPSSAVSDGVVYAVSNGITALAVEDGAVSQRWRNEGLKPGTASPLVIGDHLYVVNNAGVMIQANTKDGSENWKLRLKGPFSGSPVAAGKTIYIVSERGVFQSIDTAAEEGAISQSIDLGETVLSTPAVSGSAVYVRSDGKLWKLM